MPSPKPQWLKVFARLGYAARGVIYLVIGGFALFAAFGYSEKTDARGALQTIVHSGIGNVAAVALILGLVCYSVWRIIQALLDADGHGWEPKGLLVRAGLLVSGAVYATLTVYTFSLYVGMRRPGADLGRDIAAGFAGVIGSPMAASLLALGFAGVGVAHLVKAFTNRYAPHFQASPSAMTFIHPVATIGLAARGIIFFVIAFLFLYRGLNAGEGGGHPGLKEALDFIHGLPGGSWLLAAIGAGLIAFSGYSMIEAATRRIALNGGPS